MEQENVVVHESPNKLRRDDFRCPICGTIKQDVWYRRSEGLPTCCDQAMVAMPGGNYQMSSEDWVASKRPSNINWKADPLTRQAVLKGIERRKQRLGGTGKL
jgi:hypothetical protein